MKMNRRDRNNLIKVVAWVVAIAAVYYIVVTFGVDGICLLLVVLPIAFLLYWTFFL